MTWQIDYRMPPFWGMEPRSTRDSLPFNEQCFIRKDHKCGKLFGASKSCFIACPTEDELEPILELMSEKLSKVGVEPIIAVKERAYGQDIFCTKICGKIIESRFCIVILDDAMKEGKNIPIPNVYYEYGLMTSLRKHIIPLQKDGLELAFNIQSYDTIKYSARNIAAELDRAIKDAIRITEAKEKDERTTSLPEKTLLRKLELTGLELRDHEWILADAIEDTNFRGFGQYKKGFYVYLGKLDDPSEFQDYLDDLGVVLYRTEKKAEELERRLSENEDKKRNLTAAIEEETSSSLTGRPVAVRGRLPFTHELQQVESSIADTKSKLSLMDTLFIGIIIRSTVNADKFVSEAEELLKQYSRYKLSCSANDTISFGDMEVSLAGPVH